MPGIIVERAHDKLIADVQRLDEHIGITLLAAQPLRNEPQRGDRQIEPASMGHDRAERSGLAPRPRPRADSAGATKTQP